MALCKEQESKYSALVKGQQTGYALVVKEEIDDDSSAQEHPQPATVSSEVAVSPTAVVKRKASNVDAEASNPSTEYCESSKKRSRIENSSPELQNLVSLDVSVSFYFNQENDHHARESCQVFDFEVDTLRKLDVLISDKMAFGFWRPIESELKTPDPETSCYRISALVLSDKEGKTTEIKHFSHVNQRKYIDWYNSNIVNGGDLRFP